MFLIVSQLDMQVGFEHPFLWMLDRAQPKNLALKKKFVHPGVEITIFSGVKHFCINFLHFLFKNISCSNNSARHEKLIYMSIGMHFGVLRQRAKYFFFWKCEKTNTTLIYVFCTFAFWVCYVFIEEWNHFHNEDQIFPAEK